MKTTTIKKRRRRINYKRFIPAMIILILIISLIIKGIACLIGLIYSNVVRNEFEQAITEETTEIDIFEESDYEVIPLTYEENSIYSIQPNNMSNEYFEYVLDSSNKNNVPVEVILATLTTENEVYNPNAKAKNSNGTYDMGLCQVNSAYYIDFGKQYNIDNFDPYNPQHAIEFVAKHMGHLISVAEKDYNLHNEDAYLFAAGAYNRGIGTEIKYRNMYEYKEKFINYYYDFINKGEI